MSLASLWASAEVEVSSRASGTASVRRTSRPRPSPHSPTAASHSCQPTYPPIALDWLTKASANLRCHDNHDNHLDHKHSGLRSLGGCVRGGSED